MKKTLLWRLATLLVILVIPLIFPLKSSWGIVLEDCEKRVEKNELNLLSSNDLDACANLIEQSRQSKTNQRLNLESEIKRFNTAISITLANILMTTKQIEFLENEIISLNSKIGQLDVSLNQLSEILAKRIAETYKKGKIDILSLLLSSKDFSDFVSRFKYLKVIQLHDRSLMVQMETVRTNFEDQKTLKEQKQKELEVAKKKLESQRTLLVQQKTEKDNLLAVTKSDENRYQQLLSQVRVQIAAIRKFVTLQGGASILSNQTFCDGWGCYYNQRDSEWGTKSLGGSNLSTAEFGCLVASSAMIARHYGKNISPLDIITQPSAFYSPDVNTAYLWKDITINGVRIVRSSLDITTNNIDSELAAGRPVIVGLFNGPGHFIVIKSGSSGNYVMNDPFFENGHDISFSSHYQINDITDVERVSIL